MKEYKRDVNRLKEQLENVEVTRVNSDRLIKQAESWYKQLLDDLRILCQELPIKCTF